MPQDQSKHRAVVPGVAILGAAGAAKEQTRSVGGSVVPGKAILGDEGAREEKRRRDEALRLEHKTSDPNAKTGAVTVERVTPGSGKQDFVDRKPAPEKPPASMTTKQVRELLKTDPDAWDQVLDLEALRPEFRADVARTVLKHAPEALDNPVPDEVIAKLTEITTAASAAK